MRITRQANPRKQGDAGLGITIGWFAAHNYTVCLPLTDSQDYDLIVDNGSGLQRVWVRTTTKKGRSGGFECNLRTSGGNKTSTKVKTFDKSRVELLFIITEAGDYYMIPSQVVDAKETLGLGKKWEGYKVQD